VQKALRLLVDENIITRTIGSGTFVNDPNEKKPSSNPIIGVLLCNISASFGTEILKSIERNAEQNGYSIIFKNSNFSQDLEMKYLKEFIDLKVAGLILQPIHGEIVNKEVMNFTLSNKPIVLIDRNLSGISCPFVGSDNYSATKKVMNYLFMKGHRNICFMSSNPDKTTSIQQRLEAFKTSFSSAGIPFKDYFIYGDIRFSLSMNHIEQKMAEDKANIKAYILAHPDITCIFTLEYSICSLVQQVISEMGSEVEHRLSLVTFDFISDPHAVTQVAYVKQYEDEIGFQAVRLLMNCFRNPDEHSVIYLPTEFVNSKYIADLTGGSSNEN
jgi:GntR family transcriptional regulator of arabinose operon